MVYSIGHWTKPNLHINSQYIIVALKYVRSFSYIMNICTLNKCLGKHGKTFNIRNKRLIHKM